MYFKQILDERCGCASYLVASRQTLEAAVVDPAIDISQYEDLLRERNFRLRYVIDTHVHADHVSGARKLAGKYGAELCMHRDAQVTYPFRDLEDGEELPLGQLLLRVWHTPGHRQELISILVINPLRSPEPSMVLTGDSLLVGDVGRPDFGSGEAGLQYNTVQKLLGLPDWVAVFPGHFEGPCGKGMCGRPSTTVGFERLYNPMAQLESARFIQELTGAVPPRPLNMTAIEATNRGEADITWAMLTSAPEVEDIETATLTANDKDWVVLDVREPAEFSGGHIPRAINLPQPDLASKLDEIPRDQPIATVCRTGQRSLKVAQFLKQVGIEQVFNVEGGTRAWDQAGHPLDKADTPIDGPEIAETEWSHAGGRDTQTG